MVSFELSKEIEKYILRLITSVGQRKKSESPWEIEPQTFGFPKVHLLNTEVHNEEELRIEHNFIWRLFLPDGSAVSDVGCSVWGAMVSGSMGGEGGLEPNRYQKPSTDPKLVESFWMYRNSLKDLPSNVTKM